MGDGNDRFGRGVSRMAHVGQRGEPMTARPPTARERLKVLLAREEGDRVGALLALDAVEEAVSQTREHSEAWAAIRALRAELEESR